MERASSWLEWVWPDKRISARDKSRGKKGKTKKKKRDESAHAKQKCEMGWTFQCHRIVEWEKKVQSRWMRVV